VSCEHCQLICTKIAADNRHDANVGKETCGNGKVRGRASQHLIAFPEGRFNRIERDRTNNE
jgi:hypothetical protein